MKCINSRIKPGTFIKFHDDDDKWHKVNEIYKEKWVKVEGNYGGTRPGSDIKKFTNKKDKK